MTAYMKHGREVQGFMVRRQLKDHGTKQRIETGVDLKGKKVVVLDDVTTTGQSAMQAVDAVREAGAEVVMVGDRGCGPPRGRSQVLQRQRHTVHGALHR